VFLLASELSLFRGFFARNWPLLSPAHGFVTLALAMVVLGINMLGNLNKEVASQESLGLAFWRLVIASGILIFILGWMNLIASYVFRDRSKGITARQVRAHGAVAIHKTPMPQSAHSSPSAPELAQSYINNPITPTKSSNPFRIMHSERRDSILPSYHTSSPASPPSPPYPTHHLHQEEGLAVQNVGPPECWAAASSQPERWQRDGDLIAYGRQPAVCAPCAEAGFCTSPKPNW
jgi:hypothetical protein